MNVPFISEIEREDRQRDICRALVWVLSLAAVALALMLLCSGCEGWDRFAGVPAHDVTQYRPARLGETAEAVLWVQTPGMPQLVLPDGTVAAFEGPCPIISGSLALTTDKVIHVPAQPGYIALGDQLLTVTGQKNTPWGGVATGLIAIVTTIAAALAGKKAYGSVKVADAAAEITAYEAEPPQVSAAQSLMKTKTKAAVKILAAMRPKDA